MENVKGKIARLKQRIGEVEARYSIFAVALALDRETRTAKTLKKSISTLVRSDEG